MSDKLPNLIDPLLFAERRSILTGVLKISELERLSGMVVNTGGDIAVDARFAKQGKRAVVSGKIQTVLELECQSCLQALAWPITLAFKLAVVSSLQEADSLEIDCEPLLLNGEKVSLHDLIEDEILLAIPDYPRHEYDCIPRHQSRDSDFDDNSQTETNNPFSVLAKLKKTGE
ncbi:YceD family protein [Methylomonas rivi]|uniref:Large ribosomal RNA subunit accumulation protein YceD n=1 Tax=Methylomonas rivi TaxID=2952226 RepID=A0ABT1U321_9GAMM|nr:YceD family protein [Methylomonas sp. WSC-6]MCQ8128021.1 YceD family protein [Methylomonas sp. WSC-6]